MVNLSSKSAKRGIALFGGNFILPFENKIHLSNTLSKQYLEFCQKYNGSMKQDNLQETFQKQTISPYSFSNINNTKNQNSHKKFLQKYEYLVLAPRKSENDQQKYREFYDIGTIVQLQQCDETGGIKAVSKGVDSLVRIKKNPYFLNNKLNSYSQENPLIIENDPTIRYNSAIKAHELQYVIQGQRKLFFCDYETLHEKVPKYSDKEKEHFIQSIYALAQKTNYQNLTQKNFLESIAFDQKNNMFPRVQLFQLLQHLDSKYYFNRSNSEWLDQKYEILKTKNDEQILESLQFVSNQLNN